MEEALTRRTGYSLWGTAQEEDSMGGQVRAVQLDYCQATTEQLVSKGSLGHVHISRHTEYKPMLGGTAEEAVERNR